MEGEKSKDTYTEAEKQLSDILLERISDTDDYVCIMLCLEYEQENPDENYWGMIRFLEEYPNATVEDIYDKLDEIMGIGDPFADEE